MRTTMLRGALTLVILAFTAGSSFGQSLVRGFVRDAENKPVEGAVVSFEIKGYTRKPSEAKTDRRGEYLIVGLQSGDYKITASKEGVGIDIVNAPVSSSKQTYDFVLRAVGAASSGGAAAGGTRPAPAYTAGPVSPALRMSAITAIDALRNQRIDEAVAKLNEVITERPTCYDCYMYLGAAYSELKRTDEAEAALKKSVEIFPTMEGFTALTRFYTANQKFELAEATNKRASELAGTVVDLNSPTGKPQPGAKPAASATPAAPAAPSTESLFNSGVVLWNSGKYAEAKPMFEQAVKADNRNADAHYMLGMAQLNNGEIPQARESFENYLKVSPNGNRAAEVKKYLTQLPK